MSQLDNLLLATSLFLLGYLPLFGLHEEGRVPRELLVAFPVVVVAATAALSFNVMVNVVFALQFSRLGHEQLERLGTPAFRLAPRALLSTALFRAMVVPLCSQLLWVFAMVDFGVGAASYDIPAIVGGQAAILLLAAVWATCVGPSP